MRMNHKTRRQPRVRKKRKYQYNRQLYTNKNRTREKIVKRKKTHRGTKVSKNNTRKTRGGGNILRRFFTEKYDKFKLIELTQIKVYMFIIRILAYITHKINTGSKHNVMYFIDKVNMLYDEQLNTNLVYEKTKDYIETDNETDKAKKRIKLDKFFAINNINLHKNFTLPDTFINEGNTSMGRVKFEKDVVPCAQYCPEDTIYQEFMFSSNLVLK